jgi:predicted dehydrogenase
MRLDHELRVGVLGTGAIAQIVHLPLLIDLPGARVEGVCDIDDAKAAALASRLGIPRVFASDHDLFASDDIDAVVICSPNHLHQDQAIAALEAGKHVLVERPLALDAKGAAAVVKAAEAADRTLVVAYNNRYRQDILGVKSFVTAGELGEVFSIHGTWFNKKVRLRRPTWRHRQATSGGGAFMDLGVQVLDLSLWLLDYPKVERVTASMHPGEDMEVEDSASVLIALESGPIISVQVTWSLLADKDRHHIRLFGTAGSATTHPLQVFKEMEHGILNATPQVAPGGENPYTASYRDELRHFVAAAMGASQQPPREQIELMRVVSAIYESAEKGREVRL